MQINVHDAKTKLSALLAAVEGGEEVVIARAGKPVARIVPYVKAPGGMLLGLARRDALNIPDAAALADMDREIEAMVYDGGALLPPLAVHEPPPGAYQGKAAGKSPKSK